MYFFLSLCALGKKPPSMFALFFIAEEGRLEKYDLLQSCWVLHPQFRTRNIRKVVADSKNLLMIEFGPLLRAPGANICLLSVLKGLGAIFKNLLAEVYFMSSQGHAKHTNSFFFYICFPYIWKRPSCPLCSLPLYTHSARNILRGPGLSQEDGK